MACTLEDISLKFQYESQELFIEITISGEKKKKKNHYSFSRFLLKFQCESLRIIQWNHNIQRKKFKEIILLSRYFIEIPIWKLGIIHWNHNIWRKKQKRNHSFWRFLLKFQCESLELFNEITISREKN